MRSGSMKIATPVPSSQSIDRPPEAEGRIQGTSGSLAGPGSARRGCRGSAPAQLLERPCNTPACEPPKRARKNETGVEERNLFHACFLASTPHIERARFRAAGSCVVRRDPQREETNGNWDQNTESKRLPTACRIRQIRTIPTLRAVAASTTKTNHPPASRRGEHDAIQHRARSVKSEKSLHCKPSRFARCFSPPSCSPQRLAGVGEYKSDEAHAALVAARLLRADQRRLRFLPLGV